MRQQCGADASGPPSSCEPGSPRSQALILELSRLSRGQAQREKSLRSARVALAQLQLVATPPDGPRRVSAKVVNSITWGLRRSQLWLNHNFVQIFEAFARPAGVRSSDSAQSPRRRPTLYPVLARVRDYG